MPNTMQNLTEGPVLRSLLTLSVPIILANLLQTAYQLVDTFWVGRLGANAMAAVSLSFPIVFLLLAIGGGLATSGSILVAQYAGAQQTDMVNRIAAQTLVMVSGASLVLTVLGVAAAPWIMRLMGIGPDIFDDATAFLRISFLGLIFTFGYIVFQSVLRGVGEVRFPLYIVSGTVLLNLVLCPLFIYGWGPIPAGGVAGAAWSTLVTQALSALIGVWVLLRGHFGIQLRPADFVPDWPLIKRSFALGLPASIEQSARALGMTVMTFLVASFGTFVIATYGMGTRILSFVFIPALGLSMATSTLVGQNIGAGNLPRAREIARLSAWIGMISLSIIGLLCFFFAEAVVGFFVPEDPALIASSALFVRIMSPTFGLIGAQMALTGAFRAAGDTLITMVLALVSQWVFQFPLAYILSHKALGADGIWWAFPVTNILIAGVTVIWFQRDTWLRSTLLPESQLQNQATQAIIIEEGLGSN